MFMLFRKKAVYTFTPNLWLRQKTFGRQNAFLCLWNSFPYARKKKYQGFRLKTSMCVGRRFCGECFWVICDPLPYSDICLLFPCLSAFFTGIGESRIACVTVNTCDICCYWKLLATIKSLLHSFNHCLQWPRDCYPPFLKNNCLDFFQTVLACDWFYVSENIRD